MDSLLSVSRNGKTDSIRTFALYQYGIQYALQGKFDSAFPIIRNAKDQFFKQNILSLGGLALRDLGEIFMQSDNNDSALVYFIKAEQTLRKTNKKVALARILMSIGQLQAQRKEINAARKNYYEAAAIFKEAKDISQLGSIYQHLGGIYLGLSEDGKLHDSCAWYYNKCLELQLQTGNEYRIALAYANIASMERTRNRIKEAIDFNSKALLIFKKLNRKTEWAGTLINSAEMNMALEKYKEALNLLEEAQQLLQNSFNREYILIMYSNISKCYMHLGEFRKAYDYQIKVTALKDSLHNESSNEQITEMEKKYELEKKENQISSLNRDREISAIELKQKSRILFAVLSGLAIAMVLSILLFMNNKKRKKAMEIIANQNELLGQKNKDITDSIIYARRIQEALLPAEDLLPKLFANAFVLYKPRDIVSGDFFWLGELNGKKIAAVCDCTGHGVPGAFMSLIGHDILNRVILEEKIPTADKILEQIDFEIGRTLNKSGGEHHDGMDCALLIYDKTKNTIEFSGAYRPLVLIRNGELSEFSANKHSLGGRKNETQKTFVSHTIEVKPGDSFYLYSDGFVDQFGGQHGKKFMHKQFKETLKSLHTLTAAEQKNKLNTIFESWRGNHEQIDDVCVIGINIV